LAARAHCGGAGVRDPRELQDPFELQKVLWPHVRFYDKQRAIIASVRDDDETFVTAGNMLGA
jgi:hypothetical protein